MNARRMLEAMVETDGVTLPAAATRGAPCSIRRITAALTTYPLELVYAAGDNLKRIPVLNVTQGETLAKRLGLGKPAIEVPHGKQF